MESSVLRDSIKSGCLCQQTISSVSDDNILGGLSVLEATRPYQPELLSQKTMSSEKIHLGARCGRPQKVLLQKTISHGILFESSVSNDNWYWKRNREAPGDVVI